MPTVDEVVDAAKAAAPHWAIDPTAVELISQSENVVCRVDRADGDPVVMRLHRPGYNTLPELRSEALWVESMHEAGLPVPRPLPTLDGEYYAVAHVAGERRHVGVVDWIEGAPVRNGVRAGDVDLASIYGQLGEIAARMRVHAATWATPRGFTRRSWDVDGLVGPDPLWGRFWEVEQLTADQRSVLAAARTELHSQLVALPTSADRFGLIHADLHLGNVMLSAGDVTVIDFDDAGFGFHAYELAVALDPMFDEPGFDEAFAAMIDGYRRVCPLDEQDVGLVDTFMTVRAIIMVGWLAGRPELDEFRYLGEVIDGAVEAANRYLSRA